MSVLSGAASDYEVYLHPHNRLQDAQIPPCQGSVEGLGPLKVLCTLMEKQLTGTCACSSVPIAAQAVTDGLSETEDAPVT